jgi:hypothetical protein
MDQSMDRRDLRRRLRQIADIEKRDGLLGFRVLTRDALGTQLVATPLGTSRTVDYVLDAAKEMKCFLNPDNPNVARTTGKVPRY